jgi:2-dehydropantoate 2-reductase
MRILVVGCGGIGGIVAAKLTRAGVDVVPVTGNAEIAAAIAQHGYIVTDLDGERLVVPASSPPLVHAEGGPYDLCLLVTKATTMRDALAQALPTLSPTAPVVCLQNGLPEEIAAEQVSAERVVGCVVGWGGSMTAPGEYVRTSKGGLQLGGPRAAEVGAVLAGIGDPVDLSADLPGVRWSKLAINCATSTVGAISGARLGTLLAQRFVRRLVLEIWTEVAAVARAEGVKLAPVGGTLDIARMALTPSERRLVLGSPALAWKHSILLAVGMKYRRMRSSMLIALERGRRPEIDFLNGEVVRRAALLGLTAPVNARLCHAIDEIAAGREVSSSEHLRRVFDELAGERGKRAAA